MVICTFLFSLLALFQPHVSNAQTGAALLPPAPKNLPPALQLGLSDGPDAAGDLSKIIPGGYRYHYLAGGLNTGEGWENWRENGSFVDDYIYDAHEHNMTPFFSYYMIRQSYPGRDMEEHSGVRENVKNKELMRLFYEDLKLFFQRANLTGKTAILQVEPDMWGYMQKDVLSTNNSEDFSAIAGSSGMPELKKFPDNASGVAKSIKQLRDTYAPNVILAYPVSIWGTNVDIADANPTGDEVNNLSYRSSEYYRSLKANFDLVTIEFNDRDSGYKVAVDGQDPSKAWWDDQDFNNHLQFVQGFTYHTKKRVILWQIPLGNTRMKTMDNSPGHYQDNRVQNLLDDPKYNRLKSYMNAGVIGLLFGGGAKNTTCACDQMRDGITNPLTTLGLRTSSSVDDDGGYFRIKARTYYRHGTFMLPLSSSDPKKLSSLTTINKSFIQRGQSVLSTTRIVSPKRQKVNITIRIRDFSGKKVFERKMNNQLFVANRVKKYRYLYTSSKKGKYTIQVIVHESKNKGKRIHYAPNAASFRIR